MRADYNWEYGYVWTPFYTGDVWTWTWRPAGPYDMFAEFPSQEEIDDIRERVFAALDRAKGAKP